MRRWLLLSLAGLVAAAAVVFAAAWLSSPAPSSLDRRVTVRLSATGGKAVPLSSVTPILRQAIVATEDERFYRHHGIDVLGIMRALPYDVSHLSTAEGASTITEQVAKLLFLGGNDHSPWRKLEDMTLALKLESRYSKEQILAAYLNSAYFGEGAYGAWAASERYFGFPPGKLDVAQASLIAGLVQAPSAYDPVHHPLAARERQVAVLRSLVRNGYLTDHEAVVAIGRPLALRGGRLLPAVRGVDFSPGPAFIWWELVLGATLVAAGIAAVIVSWKGRLVDRLRANHGLAVVRLCSLVLVLAGADVVVRSFRVI
jgi:membrane peptidoglycan carboxypeptidase